ncbi:M20/M25/M40 family metallo-hydrolase [Streptomyces sp. NPDC045251]|uniref:M20/M25/M40 family metallo-hydrolase n=1 Tax=unclassified Streptomyces TaxID=2593676 RepID=UPI0033CF089D
MATVRTFSETTRAKVREGVLRTVRGIADAHGVTAAVDYRDGYPVTVNDPAETAFATAVAADLLGPDRSLTAPRPISGSEDFSLVLQEVPGAFLGAGACPAGRDPATAPTNHSPHAVHDDGVLPAAAALLAGVAARRLERAAVETTAAGPSGPADTLDATGAGEA